MDHIEQKIDKLDVKLDKVLEKLGEHSVVLAKHGLLHEKNAEELETHIARTNALEEHMDLEHRDMKKQLDEALTPIKSIRFLVKLCAAVATILGLYYLIHK